MRATTEQMKEMKAASEAMAQELIGSAPAACSTFVSRVRSNDDWLAHCQNLHREQQRRDGAYARQLREQRGLKLREVARRMGISAPMLSDLERGNRNWTNATLAAWEDALNAETGRAGGPLLRLVRPLRFSP